MTVAPVVCSARARRRMSHRPRAPLAPGMPRRLLAARTPVCSMQPGLSPPRVLSPDPVTTPGCPVLGECVRGGARLHCPRPPRGLHSPCVLSPSSVGHPRRAKKTSQIDFLSGIKKNPFQRRDGAGPLPKAGLAALERLM